MVSRLDILTELARRVAAPRPATPLELALAPLPVVGPLARPIAAVAQAGAGKAMAADVAAGKAITGAGAAAQGKFNPFLDLFPNSPGSRAFNAAEAAYGEGGAGAANEAFASGNELVAGLMNAGLSPSNALGPLGKPLQATKAARLGHLLAAVDRAQAMPLEMLAKTPGAIAKSQLARRVLAEIIPTTGKAGSIPKTQIPKVGGVRQFGPVPPPPSGVPVQLPLGEKPPPPPLALVPRTEPPQVELPAPALPGGDRDTILAGLNNEELDLLADLAYPHENAINNAVMKHGGTEGLASAALERLTRDRDKMSHLGSLNPELARNLALLPEPPGAALPDATPGQLDELVAETTLPNVDIPRGGDIAAGGGGGGGMGVLPYPGGLTGAVGRAVVPASAGGIAGILGGGAAGAIADDEDRLRGFATGASAGGAAGFALGAGGSMAGLKVPAYLKPVLAHSAREFRTGLAEAAEKSTGSVLSALKNLPTTWRINITHHPRNLIGDELWGRTVLGMGQGRQTQATLAALRDDMSQRLGAANPWDREPQQVRELQRVLGRDGQLPSLGDSMAQAEKNILTVTDTLYGEMLLSMTNLTNVAGLAFAGAKGAVRPGLRAFFEAFNGFQQATFRRAAYADEAGEGLRIAAERFLPDLQAQGVNVASLSPDGMFDVSQVRALAGQQAADRWAALTDAVRDSAERRVKFLFGDYSKRNIFEKVAGGAVPFTSWLIRAYPVGIAMLAQHPAVALGLYHYLNATKPDVAGGQPAYTAGMVPIDTDTPLIGAILEAYTGGTGGTVYADPIGAISPFGGEIVRPEESTEGQNWYQRATGWLDRMGLPGANPAIKEAAYLTGLDYKDMGNLSRTSGIEQGLGLLPFNPQLPNVVPALMAAGRGALSPALEGIVPGVEGDKYAQPFDPITRRYGELVMQQTGLPLNNPQNAAYLAGMADPDNPLLAQARREVLLGGAIKNVGSMTSPIGLVGQTDENRAYRAAAKQLPYSYEQVQGAAAYPRLAGVMEQANAGYRAGNPAADTYKIGSVEDARYEQLRAWEKANADFKFVVGDAAYNRARRKKMEELGLLEPTTTR